MTRYATTITFALHTSGKPDSEDLARIWSWAENSRGGLADCAPDTHSAQFSELNTIEVPDVSPSPPQEDRDDLAHLVKCILDGRPGEFDDGMISLASDIADRLKGR